MNGVSSNKQPTAYTCFSTDIIHEGHLNIIRAAKQYGRVVVGVMSDRAMLSYYRFPTISFAERMEMIRNLPDVDEVVIQDSVSYVDILRQIRPDYVVHSDRWQNAPWGKLREELIDELARYGGELIEVPYTVNETVMKCDKKIREKLMMPEYRRKRLRQLLEIRPAVKAMEAHNGLTGLIVEKTIVEHNGRFDQYDALWVSSLCDSTAKGKPDIELVDLSSRLQTIEEIMEVTTKPIIFDGDTGGLTEHFVYNVRTLERLGVSAVIIEDKIGLKKNSLFGTVAKQQQDSIENFCNKLQTAKNSLLTDDFMLIARVESLILERGLSDALARARAYVMAGADAIMIHSRQKTPMEIFAFCDAFRTEDKKTPLVVVPTTFNAVREEEFTAHGINIIIYANQLTRSAFPAMQKTARDILLNGRAEESEENLMSIRDIITLVEEI